MVARSNDSADRDGDPQAGRRSSLFVSSAEKAFLVLRAFDGLRRHLTVADIARLTGLDRSATQRLVYTLEALGYIHRVADTKAYALTSKVLQFSFSYVRANELIEKASPYLLEISRDLGETTNLHELDGHEIVFVARFPGRHMHHVDFMVGARLPALFTASGAAMLSLLPEAEWAPILAATPLERLTPFTQIDPEALIARVREAGERGYSMTVNETALGDISIASAISDENGRPLAAVNIAVPATQWTPERVEAELAQHVQVAASSLSKPKALPQAVRAAG